MKRLLLDIGNSSIDWAIEDNYIFKKSDAFAYSFENIEQDLNTNLSKLEKPDSILLSNVAGESILKRVYDWARQEWQLECWQPKVTADFKGLENSYQDTTQMGLDRWLSMVACWDNHQSAICLVSCGTALTIDATDKNGKHLGGYIIPGIELMQKSLISQTAQINTKIFIDPSTEFAANTQTAINNGAFMASISMIDNVVERLIKDSKLDVKCIITGGMAKIIQPLLKHKFCYEPNLVLQGLSLVSKDHE